MVNHSDSPHPARPSLSDTARPGPTRRSLWRRLHHLWSGPRGLRRLVDADMLSRLEQQIRASESGHTGQIRLCLEGALPASYLRRNATAADRAHALFSKLRVWDTAHNNGVLIYLLVAERAIEVVADRGLSACAAPTAWADIVLGMRQAFMAGQFESGLRAAIDAVDRSLREGFPRAAGASPVEDNQPDRPTVL